MGKVTKKRFYKRNFVTMKDADMSASTKYRLLKKLKTRNLNEMLNQVFYFFKFFMIFLASNIK